MRDDMGPANNYHHTSDMSVTLLSGTSQRLSCSPSSSPRDPLTSHFPWLPPILRPLSFQGCHGPYLFLRQGLILLPRLGCSSTIITHYNLKLLGSSNPPASAFQAAGNIGTCHHTWLIFLFFIEAGFDYISQAVLKLLASRDPSALATKELVFTVMSHHA